MIALLVVSVLIGVALTVVAAVQRPHLMQGNALPAALLVLAGYSTLSFLVIGFLRLLFQAIAG